MKILIIEDNQIASKILGLQLNSINCECDIADTGVEAIKQYFAKHYDLILLDIGLPDINGLTISKLIRRYETAKRIPIIAVTAHNSDSDKQAALAAGVDQFLAKPVDIQYLQNIVNKFGHNNN
jgi:CheY-like chemotaxis protein